MVKKKKGNGKKPCPCNECKGILRCRNTIKKHRKFPFHFLKKFFFFSQLMN